MPTDTFLSRLKVRQYDKNQALRSSPIPSTGPRHLPFLDLLRGVAILLVFLHHSLGAAYGYYWQPWKGMFPDFHAAGAPWQLFPLTMGNCGVAIFFVVSGFCIHLSHYRSNSSGIGREIWWSFAIKRFFRIYPPFFLALSVFYLCWPWRTYSLESPGWQHQFWSHALMLHNLDKSTFYGINGSFWSIAIELQLYLLYPILIFLIYKIGWRLSFLILFVIEVSIRLSIFPETLPFAGMHQSPLAYWFSWCLGAYAADCYLRHKISPLKPFIFIVSAAFAVLTYIFSPLAPFQFTAVSLFTMLLVWQAIAVADDSQPSQPRSLPLLHNHLLQLGIVSYSFYLIHQPILNLVSRLKDRFELLEIYPFFVLGLCLLLYFPILALSQFLYRAVEIPSARLGKIISGKSRSQRVNCS